MFEEGAISAPVDEVLDRLDFVDALAAVPELGLAREVLSASFRRPLYAHGELAGTAWSLVGPAKVPYEGLFEVDPRVDAAHRQTVQPGAGQPLEHERRVAHGEPVVAACDADGGGVVGEPVLRLDRVVVLGVPGGA